MYGGEAERFATRGVVPLRARLAADGALDVRSTLDGNVWEDPFAGERTRAYTSVEALRRSPRRRDGDEIRVRRDGSGWAVVDVAGDLTALITTSGDVRVYTTDWGEYWTPQATLVTVGRTGGAAHRPLRDVVETGRARFVDIDTDRRVYLDTGDLTNLDAFGDRTAAAEIEQRWGVRTVEEALLESSAPKTVAVDRVGPFLDRYAGRDVTAGVALHIAEGCAEILNSTDDPITQSWVVETLRQFGNRREVRDAVRQNLSGINSYAVRAELEDAVDLYGRGYGF